jgi:hypothetical protein
VTDVTRNLTPDTRSINNVVIWACSKLYKCSWGFKIGLFLAATHFTLFTLNTIYMIVFNDPQWHMIWIMCDYIDFPVSLLLTKIILPLFFRGDILYDPYLDRSMSAMMTFLVFYAVAGSTWYFLLPVLLEKAGKKIAAGPGTLAIAVVLMIIPIFSNWLQFLRFATGHTPLFTPGLYIILPAIWTGLLVWLYFTTAGKKTVLWLLLLAPFVFFYFVRDLYYYMILPHHLIWPPEFH